MFALLSWGNMSALDLLAGCNSKLPPKMNKLVVAWIEIHKEDLKADLELAVNGQNPLPIRGLDQ